MASRSLAFGGLVERFSICCERRGRSPVHYIGIGYNFIHVTDPIPILKNKADITDSRSDYRCNTTLHAVKTLVLQDYCSLV